MAGLVVTVFVGHVGYEVTRDLVHHLMDGVDDNLIEGVDTAALAVPNVIATSTKARWVGQLAAPDCPVRGPMTSNFTATEHQPHRPAVLARAGGRHLPSQSSPNSTEV